MRESIAFWYEPLANAGGIPPDVELHFNLWRDLFVPNTNFFDVGIKFLKSTDGRVLSNSVDSFFLFIPGRFQLEQCFDLSPLMHQGRTLNAVFNDVVIVTAQHQHDFEIAIGTAEQLTFHKVNIEEEINIEHIEMDGGRSGTIFRFSSKLCLRLKQVTNHYLRLRFRLDATTRELFTSESEPSEWFLLPSFARTELTEFRWNERRSFPPSITRRTLRYFDIRTVHYFLVRDTRFELISAHTDFRKIRRLEDHLWQDYLHGVLPNETPDWRIERALARGKAREMIIYHWRVRSKDAPIDDFIAFAKFRVPIPNLFIYAIAIVCLGGAGNALYGLISVFMVRADSFRASPSATIAVSSPTVLQNILAGIILMLLAWVCPPIAAMLIRLGAWIFDLILGLTHFIKRRLRC